MLDMILTMAVISLAIYGLCVSDNIIKTIVCFNIIQAAMILMFIILAADTGYQIPIISDIVTSMVDPLPQALLITAIVISASITALALMFTVKIFHYYGTLNWHELAEKEVDQ
jgi:multicomponent Na+:H+ antiporter subunit C